MPQRLPAVPLLTALTVLLAACTPPAATPPPAGTLSPQALEADLLNPATWPSLEEGEAPAPDIGIDPGVFQGRPGTDTTDSADLTAQASATDGDDPFLTYLTCRNEPSGPYLRLQTDPGRTGPVNFVQGTATLPAVQATPTAFPYVYLGGQPQAGVAADAGVYVNYDGSWIPFIAVAGPGGTRNLPRDTTSVPGKTFVYRLDGAQDVQLRLSVRNDHELRLDITAGHWVQYELKGTALTRVGSVGPGTRTVVHPLATGWKASGEHQVYKVMTTIAFPGKGNFRYLTQNYDFLGSAWQDLTTGRLAPLDAAGQPTGEDWQVPFTKARLYSACAAPHDVVTPTKTALLPRASAQIHLRRPASTHFPGGTTFQLTIRPHQTERARVSLQNTGPAPALVHYQVTPLGRDHTIKTTTGLLQSTEQTSVPFHAICPATPGTTTHTFDVLYAQGETVQGSNATSTTPETITTPSALPGAHPGDLLYHAQPVTVTLTCTDP